MHPYDPFLQPHPSQIPAMRPAQDGSAGQSATPIYDALFSEFRRSFRTLPGDRSGEEDVVFRAFGTTTSTGLYGNGQGYGAGQGYGGGQRYASAYPPAWTAQQHHTPAALPPGPRRGF
ncbi:hypothetical protein EF909_30900 [Streptomyces sp. WAC01280]|nr:hypothetical protein EF909_30900 [Streptomyces sp. WAC01280]